MCQIVTPFSFVKVAIEMDQSAMAVHRAVPPLTFVHATVGPDLPTPPISLLGSIVVVAFVNAPVSQTNGLPMRRRSVEDEIWGDESSDSVMNEFDFWVAQEVVLVVDAIVHAALVQPLARPMSPVDSLQLYNLWRQRF